MINTTPDYLNPSLPAALKHVQIPVIKANAATVKGYGYIVNNPDDFKIEITRWPPKGWRPVDEDSGNEGGTTEGTFYSQWKGDILYGSNEAVGGKYVLGYSKNPEDASEETNEEPEQILLWHSNYHPDGGQMFYPLDKRPFLVPVALPGDDVTPEDFICFLCDGTHGLYIHADIWHEGVFAISGLQRFLDRQGAVHARVSVDFAREFNCLLKISMDDVARASQ